jgi:hypothetical protein
MEMDKSLLVRIAFPNARTIRFLGPREMDRLWDFVILHKIPNRAYKFYASISYGLYGSGVNFEINRDGIDVLYACVEPFCNSSANGLSISREWGVTLDAIALTDNDDTVTEVAMEFEDALKQYGRDCISNPRKVFDEKVPCKTDYGALVVLDYLGHHDLVDRAYELYGIPVKLYRDTYARAKSVMDKVFARWSG